MSLSNNKNILINSPSMPVKAITAVHDTKRQYKQENVSLGAAGQVKWND